MCLNLATVLSINLGSHPHLTPFVLLKSLQGLVNGLKCTAVLFVKSRIPSLLLNFPRVYKRLLLCLNPSCPLCLPMTPFPIVTPLHYHRKWKRLVLCLKTTAVPYVCLGPYPTQLPFNECRMYLGLLMGLTGATVPSINLESISFLLDL